MKAVMLHLLLLLFESALVCSVSFLLHEAVLTIALLLIYSTIRPTLAARKPVLDLSCAIVFPILLGLVRFVHGSGFPWPLASLILLAGSLAGVVSKYLTSRKGSSTVELARHQMLSTLAHEIRTPLTIMQTTEHVLMEQIPGPLNGRQRKFMESIYINTQRLITFSENMLTLLKLERDWQPDLSKTIDLRILIRQVAETMEPMLMVKNQQIRLSFPSLLSRPRADEAWIRQVLVNLIHNSSKHTDPNGTILVTVTQDDNQVVVTVTDNGHGLLYNQRETLFREFYQEKQESQDGFGLGLSIVRAIIERHHGKVYISSTKEMGTMVSFNLPAEAVQ